MIRLEHVSKVYKTKTSTVEACTDISFDIEKGEIFGIIGFSGAGKSTLIRCINLLECPTKGKVWVDEREMTALSDAELRKERRNIGMIFQQFNLLMQKTALQNICFPLLISGLDKSYAEARARELLETVGLPDKADSYPSQLSGGQMQRIAIARALATNPKVLLCDEATSALDPTTTRQILTLLKDINKKLGITIVIITHEMTVIEEICNRVAIMDDSRIAELGPVSEVFANPKSSIAKKLIFPDGKDTAPFVGGNSIRVIFDGESSFEPIIGNMVLECGSPVNILYADTKVLNSKAYGQMVIQLPEDENAALKIRTYLSIKGITFEEDFIENV